MKTALIWIIIGIALIFGGWYWWSTHNATAPAASPSTTLGINGSPDQGNMGQPDNGTPQQPAAAAIIGANLALGTDSNAALGTYLIAYNGMTLYTFSKDTTSASTCYDTCASNWPPYIVSPTDNIQQLQAGVSGTVSTTVRTDGQLQLTYNAHPLYFYIKDTKSGDTAGQAVGGVWYVVKP